jgi:hypothetical protein
MTKLAPDRDVKFALDVFGKNLTPNRRAAAEACLRAINEPGCLVRVTFTDVMSDQALETSGVIEHVLRIQGLFDAEKTRKNFAAGNKMFELTNGSAIEFALDVEAAKKAFKEHKEREMKTP